MLNYIIKFFLGKHTYLGVPLASLLLLINFGASEAKPLVTKKFQNQALPQKIVRAETFSKDTATMPKGKLPETNGIYLYGQSPQPQQIGQEYMVFEVNQGKVIGAFYLPRSEFNCFQGTLASGKLALKIANSPDSAPYSEPIASQNSQVQLATANNSSSIGDSYESIASTYSVQLENYYQLSSASDSDQQILSSCKNNY